MLVRPLALRGPSISSQMKDTFKLKNDKEVVRIPIRYISCATCYGLIHGFNPDLWYRGRCENFFLLHYLNNKTVKNNWKEVKVGTVCGAFLFFEMDWLRQKNILIMQNFSQYLILLVQRMSEP